jgi:type IV pilus assembly protein PilB
VVCPKCRESHEVPRHTMIELGVPEEVAKDVTAWRGNGCQYCGGTGFRGRTALYEMMGMTDQLRELILSGASAIELKRQAIADGMKSLRQSGIEKVADGVTSIEEVMRVTMND